MDPNCSWHIWVFVCQLRRFFKTSCLACHHQVHQPMKDQGIYPQGLLGRTQIQGSHTEAGMTLVRSTHHSSRGLSTISSTHRAALSHLVYNYSSRVSRTLLWAVGIHIALACTQNTHTHKINKTFWKFTCIWSTFTHSCTGRSPDRLNLSSVITAALLQC